jgi:hypothetical protein
MTILGIRWTAREWTDRLSTRLAHAPQVERLHVDGPLRLALWHGGRGPYLIDATRAYEAYSRSTDTALLDTTVASMSRPPGMTPVRAWFRGCCGRNTPLAGPPLAHSATSRLPSAS